MMVAFNGTWLAAFGNSGAEMVRWPVDHHHLHHNQALDTIWADWPEQQNNQSVYTLPSFNLCLSTLLRLFRSQSPVTFLALIILLLVLLLISLRATGSVTPIVL
jgi:hypothetical protein